MGDRSPYLATQTGANPIVISAGAPAAILTNQDDISGHRAPVAEFCSVASKATVAKLQKLLPAEKL